MRYFISTQKIDSPRFKTTDDIQIVIDWLDNLQEKLIVHDTETTDLDPYTNTLLLTQFGNDKDQFVIDHRHPEVYKLGYYVESKDYRKIYANAKFDVKQWWHHMGVRTFNAVDVLVIDRCIYNGIYTMAKEAMFKVEHGFGRFSLNGVYYQHFKETLDKNVRSSFIGHKGDFLESQIVYAADDVDIPYKVYKKQLQLLDKYNLRNLIEEIENNTSLAIAEMEYNGIGLDTDLWMDLYYKNMEHLQELEGKMDELILADSDLNKKYGIGKQLGLFAGTDKRACKIKWSSPKQKIELLEHKGFDLWVKDDKTGEEKKSVDIKVLSQYKKDWELIPLLIEYGETAKATSAYGVKFLDNINDVTKRIHTNFLQVKNTGRFGSASPNLQNIKAESDFRGCFKPALPTNTFITSDYSNMELRIIGDKSKEPVLIDAFNAGEDVHSKMAMMIEKVGFGREIEVSKTVNPDKRTNSKTITFALAFGASAYKVSEQLNIPIEVAQELVDAYFFAMPGLKVLFNDLKYYGTSKGYIRTFAPYNRLRWFPEYSEYKSLAAIRDKTAAQFSRMMKIKGAIERASSNTPIQGSAADIVKKALQNLLFMCIDFNREHGIDNPKDLSRARLLLQVHDEIVIECDKKYAPLLEPKMKEIMEKAGEAVVDHLIMVAEPVISEKWTH